MHSSDQSEREVDIVLIILDMVRAASPSVTPEQASEIEQRVRVQFGGMRTRIAKRKKHPTPEQREKAVQDALHQSMAETPIEEIAKSNGISRRALYRYIKRGT